MCDPDLSEYGVPEAMLMDHGVPWWGTANRLGLTRLSVDLMEQGIRLYYSGVGHPQTQGKVERFHRTLSEGIRHRGGPPQQFAQWGPLLKAFRRNTTRYDPTKRCRCRYRLNTMNRVGGLTRLSLGLGTMRTPCRYGSLELRGACRGRERHILSVMPSVASGWAWNR